MIVQNAGGGGDSLSRTLAFAAVQVRHLTSFSHHLTTEGRDRSAIILLRLLTVLTVLSKYAFAR